MVLKRMLKRCFAAAFLLFFSSTILHAEELVFSGKPAAGKKFLCTFSIQKNINRKMEIRGAKEPPSQIQITDFSLLGTLLIRENSSKALLFQFIPDSFVWLENNQRKTAAEFSKIKIDVALDQTGRLRLCRIAPDQHAASSLSIPPALQAALLQLGRSLQSTPNNVLGPDSKRKIGEDWQFDNRLIHQLAKNKNIPVVNKKEWDSKILFTKQEKFFDFLVNRIDANLITNKIPGYDCRINMTYLFPVDDPQNTGAISYVLDWMECVDKIMPENNPIFSGTKMVEIMTMSIKRDLIPLKD